MLIMVLVEPSLGSSTGLAFYSLKLVAAVHVILLLSRPGRNGLVCHPHVSLSRAYVGEIFIEIMRAFKLSLASYSKYVDDIGVFEFFRNTCIRSTTCSPFEPDIGHSLFTLPHYYSHPSLTTFRKT